MYTVRTKIRNRVLPCLLNALLSIAMSPVAQADIPGHGRVSMQGSIIDTACTIDMASLNQSVMLPTVPASSLLSTGEGPSVPFRIQLTDCVLHSKDRTRPGWHTFQVTFDGPTSNSALFDVLGTATGIGLRITSDQGEVAVPGKPMATGLLTSGTMRLNYRLQLALNHARLVAGDYRAIIRFKLDYF